MGLPSIAECREPFVSTGQLPDPDIVQSVACDAQSCSAALSRARRYRVAPQAEVDPHNINIISNGRLRSVTSATPQQVEEAEEEPI